jgi:hypothetical protein
VCIYIWKAYKRVGLYLINIFKTRSKVPSERKSSKRRDTLSWCFTRPTALISSFSSFYLYASFYIQHCTIHQTIISCANDCLTRIDSKCHRMLILNHAFLSIHMELLPHFLQDTHCNILIVVVRLNKNCLCSSWWQ